MRLAQKAAPSGSGLSLSWALQELRKQLGGDGFSLEGHLHRRPTGPLEARTGEGSSQQSGLSTAVRPAVGTSHARTSSARVCPSPAAPGLPRDLSAPTLGGLGCRGPSEPRITAEPAAGATPLPAPRAALSFFAPAACNAVLTQRGTSLHSADSHQLRRRFSSISSSCALAQQQPRQRRTWLPLWRAAFGALGHCAGAALRAAARPSPWALRARQVLS